MGAIIRSKVTKLNEFPLLDRYPPRRDTTSIQIGKHKDDLQLKTGRPMRLSRPRTHPGNFLFQEMFFPAAHFLSVEEIGVIA